VEHLLTAFQAASGVVRAYRNRHVPHNDVSAIIRPHEPLLPGVGRAQIEEILQLAALVLRAVSRHLGGADPEPFPAYPGGASELIGWLTGRGGSVQEPPCIPPS
jgi:hypothetical protein